VVFPRRAKKPKNGDASAADLQTADQLKGALMPYAPAAQKAEFVTLSAAQKGVKAYYASRLERMNLRQLGPRIKKAELAEAEAKDKAKLGA